MAVTAIGIGNASDRVVPDEQHLYIVLGGGSNLRTRITQAGFEILHELAEKSVLIIQGPEDRLNQLQSMAVIEDVIPDEVYAFNEINRTEDELIGTNGSLYEKQWDKQITQTAAAHDLATGKGTTVAVIDSGISHIHPVLEPNIDVSRGRLFRYGRIHSGSNEVLVAEKPGTNSVVSSITQPVAGDVSGHGTPVAGITAAVGNDTGIIGMAPNANIVSLRTMFFERINEFIGTLVGTITDTLLAIDYAVEIGVDVINLSFGHMFPSNSRAFTAYRRLVQYAIEHGVVVVAAARNQGINLNKKTEYILPADTLGTITVAATGPTDKRSYYSNYGDRTVDVAAPGGGYETSEKTKFAKPERVEYPGSTNKVLSAVAKDIHGSHYDYVSGTSMAAPQVSGLACLLRELNPDLHPRRVHQAIEQGAIELSGEYTSGLGAGRINALKTLERVAD
ncbi:S8 family peptidase [Halostagnicola kamekurae]|nr:S8 family serine peptidase [Halostagnicola kamekurae]